MSLCKVIQSALGFPAHAGGALEHLHFLLHQLIEKVDIIMANESEILAELALVKQDVVDTKDKLVKVSLESSATLDKVTELEAIIAAGGGVGGSISQTLVDAVADLKQQAADLKAQAQLVDDLVPDAT